MIRQLIGTLATVVLLGAGMVASWQPATAGESRQSAMVDLTRPLADPSPTLGSTPQPDRAADDDNDGNSSDYTQVPLAVLAPLGLGVVVGGSVLFYFIRRARRGRAEDTRIRGGGSGHR